MTVAKLKPCPWCGGVLQEARVVEGDTFRWRKLQGCCTDGPEVHIDTLADDRVGAEERAAQAAIDAWNTRAPQWHPIETAPKDGTAVLATSAHMTGPNGEPVAWAAIFDQGRERWEATWDGEPLNDATHWQPLPAAPEVSDGQ